MEAANLDPGRGGTAAGQRWLTAAMVAAPISVLAWLADGAGRVGYDPWRHQISHLALGERGWLGAAEIALTGLAVLAAAAGLRGSSALGARVPRILVIAAAGLLAAAVFPIDPGQGYPPGVDAARSWHGTVHDVAGLVVFAALTVAPAIAGRRLRAVRRIAWSRLSFGCAFVVPVTWLAGSVLTGLDYAGVWPAAPSGLFERVALASGVLWVAGICGGARRESLADAPPARQAEQPM